MPRRLPLPEFIAMVAMMFAMTAFSIDAMLPALTEIGAALSPDAPARAQWIITSFVLGMGLGTVVTGPLSDAFGRKPVILAGALVYLSACVLAILAPSLELLLAARVLQGLGVSAPRVVTIAIVRDLFEGRQMARIMSFAMLVFTLVPAVAPAIGAGIIGLTGWRGIFGAFIVFVVAATGWLMLRQSETNPPENRRPFRADEIWAGLREVFSNRLVMLAIAALTLVFGLLFAVLSATQPIFEQRFGNADRFPLWFAFIALCAAPASLINALLVVRLGMRRIVIATVAGLLVISAVFILITVWELLQGPGYFYAYIGWTVSVFFSAGMTIGNLNALALMPMGHIAGLATSAITAIATVASVAIAVPIGLISDGDPLPVAVAAVLCMSAALICAMMTREAAVAAG